MPNQMPPPLQSRMSKMTWSHQHSAKLGRRCMKKSYRIQQKDSGWGTAQNSYKFTFKVHIQKSVHVILQGHEPQPLKFDGHPSINFRRPWREPHKTSEVSFSPFPDGDMMYIRISCSSWPVKNDTQNIHRNAWNKQNYCISWRKESVLCFAKINWREYLFYFC